VIISRDVVFDEMAMWH
jgi:hypothetical protein